MDERRRGMVGEGVAKVDDGEEVELTREWGAAVGEGRSRDCG